jgi:glucose/arabinose dehydrogenase
MLHPRLDVRPVVTGLGAFQPTTMAFLGPNDLLVLQKAAGLVRRVSLGSGGWVLQSSPVLDLAVNYHGGRGLMGIALHPNFATNSFVYLYWTESSSGADTIAAADTPLLGNRVDRFVWNGTTGTLAFDRNIIQLRALDEIRPNPGLYGGVIAFGRAKMHQEYEQDDKDQDHATDKNIRDGLHRRVNQDPDRKLYIHIGDVNRRGQLQNLECGAPLPPPTRSNCSDPIDNDGSLLGPEPYDAHLTGVVLRLNDDGTTPTDNPFFAAGAAIGGEVGKNIQRIFAYGFRNSFGMAFDPIAGHLWMTDNADDTFDELIRVEPGLNSGWVQFFGPVGRVAEFKALETTFGNGTLFLDTRWTPAHIASTPEEALTRLFMLPGAHYSDPEFSWKWAVPPGAIGFAGRGTALGPQFRGDLFMGGATGGLQGGHLFHFNLTGNRRKIAVDDPRLEDRVADNLGKNDITESESLLIGRDFGTVTDIEEGPNGNLYVLSLSKGTIYEIFRRRPCWACAVQ